MTTRLNTGEGGTDGTNVTIQNSGGASGTAFDEVTGAIAYSASSAINGKLGFRTAASTTQYTRMTVGESKVVAKFNAFFEQAPNGNTPIRIAMTSGAMSIIFLSNNTPQLYLGGKGGIATGPNALVANRKYRFTLWFDDIAGQARASIYEVDSGNNVWDTGVISSLTLNQPTYAYIGKYDTSSIASDWDDVQVNSGSDGVYDATAPTTPLPAPSITVTQKNPTTVNGTDGSITITWAAVSGANHYEAAITDGNQTAGFTASDANATSPKTFSGLKAGTYTVAVRAKATA